jgi:uncharacterized membrane protein YidH (DUF202 family)
LASVFGSFLLVMGALFVALGYGHYYGSVYVRGVLLPSSIVFILGVILIISGAAILVFPTVARRLGE